MDIVAKINDEIQSVKASIAKLAGKLEILEQKIEEIDNVTALSSSSDPTNSERRKELVQDKSSLREEKIILQTQLAEWIKMMSQSNNQGKNSLYLFVFTYTIISFMLYLLCNYSISI